MIARHSHVRRTAGPALFLIVIGSATPVLAQLRTPVTPVPPAAVPSTKSSEAQLVQQLRLAVAKCWVVDIAAPPAAGRSVEIDFELRRNGSLFGAPRIINRRGVPTPVALAQSAIRAIQTCAPYANLPAEVFADGTRRIRMTFDAKGF